MYSDYMIIDAHAHIYPEKIAAAAVRGTGEFYQHPMLCDGTLAGLFAEGETVSVDRFVVQSVATAPKQVSSINTFIADSVAHYPDRLVGLGTLHPDSETVAADVAQIRALGLHGVKLHPDIQRFAVDEKKCMVMYECCEEAGLPILMHTGDYRYDYSNPDRVLRVLKAFPRLVLVAAHLGGWSVFEEAGEKLSGIENLYVDTSSCFGFADHGMLKRVMDMYGADRILFGTDFPMWTTAPELKALLSLDFSKEEFRKILSENAKKVYRI